MSVLVVLEQRAGGWHRLSLEALAAGRQIAQELGAPCWVAVPGQNVSELAADAARRGAQRVFTVEHELLGRYTPDGYTAALESLIREEAPQLVLFPHTYEVRDYAPRLAVRFGACLLSDAIRHRVENGSVKFSRQLFQGKLNADLQFTGAPPHFASLQAGAYRAAEPGGEPGQIVPWRPPLEAGVIRTQPEEPFRESQRTVDLTAAPVIVAVGRGIRDKDNLPLVEKLAAALGAELAASRPICDNEWLPMERQVGSSGQTVSPKLYIAVGISGAIQHLVGMKGSKTIVAINKDPDAPIFEVADYGIVGDLFEIVPALAGELSKGA